MFGISYDSPRTLKKFKTKYRLPFHFLSDYKKEVAQQYGAASLAWPKRMTFIIDKDGAATFSGIMLILMRKKY